MHKRKDEIRDIYQSLDQDFEKDFTPQVAQEQLEARQRDLRRSRIISIFFGVLMIVLSIALISLVIHNYLTGQASNRKAPAVEPRDLPEDALLPEAPWVMDCQQLPPQAETNEKPGPEPLSTKWIKIAAYQIIMGQQALTLNQPEKALEYFQKVIDIYPNINGLHSAVGMLYLKQNDYTHAVVHLKKALKEEETFDTINNLGAACLGLEDYNNAEKYLKRALELRPEDSGCHKNLAELYRKMKLDDKAVFHFEKYLDLQPDDLDTLQTYALYLTQLGRWKDAATSLTKLTKEVTDVAPLYFLLAQAQIQNGRTEKAMDALKLGIPLVDPQLALTWMSSKEFDAVRNTADFKALVNRLKTGAVPPEPKQPGSAVP